MLKVFAAALLFFLFGTLLIECMEEDCVDFYGNIISHGYRYIPGPNVCSNCVCYHSHSLWCKAIFCEPPYFCKKFRIGEKCCEFDCLDSPEEIRKEKERLKKRKRFLGIVYGDATKAHHSSMLLLQPMASLLGFKLLQHVAILL